MPRKIREDPGNPIYDMVSAELYEKAVAAQSSAGALIAEPSGLYARTGDLAKAEAVLNARLKADPKDVAIRSALALLYIGQKEIR